MDLLVDQRRRSEFAERRVKAVRQGLDRDAQHAGRRAGAGAGGESGSGRGGEKGATVEHRAILP